MPDSSLKNFLARYVTFSEPELADIAGRFKFRRLRKNDHLLSQGETCRDLVFVNKGCLRLYYIKDDVEVSVWFAFADSSAIEISSFISGRPSEYYIQAIEDSEIMSLKKTELENLYVLYPRTQEMMRRFWEDAVTTLIERFTVLERDPAEKRYLDLINKPRYLETIPQKYLASFIGVTPTSLSRIRKQIASPD